jgi:N-methylhydantoinase B
MVPGSISADAPDLFAEGLVVPPLHLMRNGAVLEETVTLFAANSRTPDARAGDLRAQVAGNVVGERRLLELYERFGATVVAAAVELALDASEARMRAALRALGNGAFDASDALEDRDGTPSLTICLRMTLRDGNVHFDYAGTHPQVGYPLNAVFGVTLSGVHYALRAVTDPTIPMNDGCFRPVSVDVPEGTLLNPRRPAPVGGGNVETSTRNADVVLQALSRAVPARVPAASGGTMSNVMIGGTSLGRSWAFYETNGCGMGARPTADGIDGIQCHMTNTLNTPIEAIERDYPLRVTRYEFAPGTGGAGRFHGGSGLIRAVRLLDGTAQATLLADRHTKAPPGALGGGDGARGVHQLFHDDGTAEPLAAKCSFAWHPGETIQLQTPGGGGYGVGVGVGDGAGDGDAAGGRQS